MAVAAPTAVEKGLLAPPLLVLPENDPAAMALAASSIIISDSSLTLLPTADGAPGGGPRGDAVLPLPLPIKEAALLLLVWTALTLALTLLIVGGLLFVEEADA